MEKILGVRFRTIKNMIYYKGEENKFFFGEEIVCKTKNGIELGNISFIGEFDENQFKKFEVNEEQDILRKATDEDLKKNKENLKFEEQALKIGVSCIKKQNLDMNVVEVVGTLDRSKIIFFFTSDERVDFRILVRTLAYHLHARVELKQIGIRDEAKMVCGLGVCGRPFCCSSFLTDFNHVSIKMAKDQNLSLNPKKISGCCGKLMCCLQYEQDSYNFLNKVCPKIGSVVMSPDGEGVVVNGNPLTGKYRLRFQDQNEEEIERVYNKESLKIIKESKLKKKSSKKKKKTDLWFCLVLLF